MSIPQPTGTSRKVCSASAPSSRERDRGPPGSCFELWRAIVMLICTDMPSSFRFRSRRSPLRRRPESRGTCRASAASAPSRLMETRRTPLSTILRATSLVTSVPLVPSATRIPFLRGETRELKNVGTVERFAAAEHQDRTAEIRDLRNDVEGARGGKIVGGGKFGGCRAAMHASQVAAVGHFPENQPWNVFLLASSCCCHCLSLPGVHGSFWSPPR